MFLNTQPNPAAQFITDTRQNRPNIGHLLLMALIHLGCPLGRTLSLLIHLVCQFIHLLGQLAKLPIKTRLLPQQELDRLLNIHVHQFTSSIRRTPNAARLHTLYAPRPTGYDREAMTKLLTPALCALLASGSAAAIVSPSLQR